MACVTAGGAVFIGNGVLQDIRQVQSYAVLQTMRDTVERIPQLRRDGDAIRQAIQQVTHGRDAWGNGVYVGVKEIDGAASYVLVSYGADGLSDVHTTDDYFTMAPADIREHVNKDIVVRDGEIITFAGK